MASGPLSGVPKSGRGVEIGDQLALRRRSRPTFRRADLNVGAGIVNEIVWQPIGIDVHELRAALGTIPVSRLIGA